MMAWTQTDLDRIDAALASETKRVQFADGRLVEYHTKAEMLQVRNLIRAEIAAAASQVNPIARATRARMIRR
jgi:phage baseplate assembly protein gpV